MTANIYDVCHEAGGMSKYEWNRDPKRLGFILARYKFVAKMLAGKHLALEVGCADGFGTRLVRREVGHVIAIDSDKRAIEQAIDSYKSQYKQWPIEFECKNFLDGYARDYSKGSGTSAVYCLDVIEHVHPDEADIFIERLFLCAPVCIIGTPSLESQKYASELSKQGHVNCMSGEELRMVCEKRWSQVFMFGMNDETLHTGFLPMSHYLFALCVR